MNDTVRTAVIAAVSGVFASMIAGSFDIFGQREKNDGEVALARLRLESDLVLKVRDYDDDVERLNYLCFVTKTGIVKQISADALKENGLVCPQTVTVPGPPTSFTDEPADPNFYQNANPAVMQRVSEALALVPSLPKLSIAEGALSGGNVTLVPEPASNIAKVQTAEGLIFHVSCIPSAEAARAALRNNNGLAHVFVGKDGRLFQLKNFNLQSASLRRSSQNPNGNSGWINVDLDYLSKSACADSGMADEPPTAAQIASVMQLARLLQQQYRLKTISGHYDLDPGRRSDPGRMFPMKAIQDYANQESP